MIGWKQKETTVEFTPKADKDALYMVLGKDHKGRVQGTGRVRLGLKMTYGKEYTTSKLSVNTPQNLDTLREELRKELREEMREEMAAMFKRMREEMESSQGNVSDKSSHCDPSATIEALKNAPDSVTLDIKEDTPCEFLLPESSVDSKLVVVAYGRAQPSREGHKVHLAGVRDDALSVSIETIISGFEDIALPIPRPEWSLEKLVDAQGNFVTWPRTWVRFYNEVLKEKKRSKAKKVNTNKKVLKANIEKNRANDEEVDSQARGNNGEENVEIKRNSSKGSTPHIKAKGSPLLNASLLKSLTQACFWVHNYICNLPDDKPVQVTLDKSQFNYFEDTCTWVSKGDFCEFLTGAMLNVSVLQAFMSKLSEDLIQNKSFAKVGWMCPQEISGLHCLQNPLEVKDYIETSLNESFKAGLTFIIAPYLQDVHWLLLVIALSTSTIYQFDSLIQEQPRDLLIKSMLNGVIRKMSGRSCLNRTSLPHWKFVHCAQQETGLDCGYYVMRFMHDIVSTCTEVNDLEKVYNTSREAPFTVEEINVVRDKFALFISECLSSL